MIAPDNSRSALLHNDPGKAASSSELHDTSLSRLLRFWISDRMLLLGVAGFLAGYFVMWNVELQLMWQVAVCVPAGICLLRKTRADGMGGEIMLRLAAAFLVWNIAVGVVRNPEAFADYYTFEFLAGGVLLPVYLGSIWLVCRREEGARCLVQVVIASALFAAVTSIGWWYFVLSEAEPGARLRNPLVHGGLHPVATAITLGFAVVAASAACGRAATKKGRMALLGVVAVISLAIMLTLSRGALLAMVCVPVAFGLAFGIEVLRAMIRRASVRMALQPLMRGWRRAWQPLATVAAVAFSFHAFAGALTPVTFSKTASGTEAIPLSVLTDSPFLEYLARGDSGRLGTYREGLACIDSWDKHLTGAGLWEAEMKLERMTGGGIDHLHSLFVATYLHSGVIGSAMLLSLIGLGIRRAWVLTCAGQPQWFALLAYGLGGLLADGQSACSLVTHPRFENLILWFPLVAIAATWRNRLESQAGRQPSSSTSR